jgi:hypothetical protein
MNCQYQELSQVTSSHSVAMLPHSALLMQLPMLIHTVFVEHYTVCLIVILIHCN